MPAITIALALCLVLSVVPTAEAAPSTKKAIRGPAPVEGRSQFPVYRDLGVDIYQVSLNWSVVAPTRPARPTDPDDPAYLWPELDFVVGEARLYGIRVLLQMIFTPVAWEGDTTSSFRVELQIDGWDRHRLLEDLSRTFAETGINILEARCTVVHPMVKNRFVVEVGDTESLRACITRIRNIESVFDAYRVTPTG